MRQAIFRGIPGTFCEKLKWAPFYASRARNVSARMAWCSAAFTVWQRQVVPWQVTQSPQQPSFCMVTSPLTDVLWVSGNQIFPLKKTLFIDRLGMFGPTDWPCRYLPSLMTPYCLFQSCFVYLGNHTIFKTVWWRHVVCCQACFGCPGNRTDCYRPHCVAGDGMRRGLVTVNRQMPGPPIEVKLFSTNLSQWFVRN